MRGNGVSTAQIVVGDFADDAAWGAHDDGPLRNAAFFGNKRPGRDQPGRPARETLPGALDDLLAIGLGPGRADLPRGDEAATALQDAAQLVE